MLDISDGDRKDGGTRRGMSLETLPFTDWGTRRGILVREGRRTVTKRGIMGKNG